MSEHTGISHKTGKKIKVSNFSAIKEHAIFADHAVLVFDFKSICANKLGTYNGRKILEALLIKKKRPLLNNQVLAELKIF